ncbi:excalibur calcium-binding domain-containing protein [Croceicoccus sp. Ery15]|uniref:excalibur calcium-binding domain-containing protein n=1 Tax=Croceicoccus sp. Ery15 TaxID=1703338 RepID=UPI001E35D1B5|nr:excalibur calcium-binding domain-containing protein [Croceicoccus sp. Ery15]
MRSLGLALAALTLLSVPPVSGVAFAHPGGLASDGCHNDRKNGGRHCHRAPSGQSSSPAPVSRLSAGSAYPNCAAARAAGAAPVRRGKPGYGRHLDRDNDGIGCE